MGGIRQQDIRPDYATNANYANGAGVSHTTFFLRSANGNTENSSGFGDAGGDVVSYIQTSDTKNYPKFNAYGDNA